MKMIDDVIIIGIDSGYGNIKTANCCFPANLSAYDREPVFKENLLVYESKFYLIGEGHKEFLADTVHTTQSFKDLTTLQLYCRRLQRSGRLETHRSSQHR